MRFCLSRRFFCLRVQENQHSSRRRRTPPAQSSEITAEETETEENQETDAVPAVIDPRDKPIMTIEVPEDTPIADSNGEIPGADAVLKRSV